MENQVQLAVIDRAFVLTRVFDAPVALVYKVWSEPAHFAKWWGPHTFTNPVCEMDMHVGGKFQVTMHSPEGEDNPLKGEFKEIVPNHKIVLQMFTNGHTKEWRAIVNQARGAQADARTPDPLTTVLFEDAGGKTKLTIEQRFENNIDRDAFLQLGTKEGWGQSFVKMDSLLATLGTEREIFVFRTFDAPRALVWKVWTDPAHSIKWWGPNGFTNTYHSHDFRVGGEWLYIMHGPDGTDYDNWVRFDEIVVPERIAYTHGSFRDDPNSFHASATFSEVEGNKTHLTLRLVVASAEVRAGHLAYGAFEGGDQTLSRLGTYLKEM